MYIITKENKHLVYDELTSTYELNGDIIVNDDVEIIIGLVITPSKETNTGIVVPRLRINGSLIAKSLDCDVDVEVAGNVTASDGNVVVKKGISVARSLTVEHGSLIAGGKINVIDALNVNGKVVVEPLKTNSNEIIVIASSMNVTEGIRICENILK